MANNSSAGDPFLFYIVTVRRDDGSAAYRTVHTSADAAVRATDNGQNTLTRLAIQPTRPGIGEAIRRIIRICEE